MRAIAARDAGLALASQIKRWLLAGALTLSGLFSLLAAQAFHGHVRTASARTSSSGSAAHTNRAGGDEGAGLQQPASAPASAPAAAAPAAPAPVVSGGS